MRGGGPEGFGDGGWWCNSGPFITIVIKIMWEHLGRGRKVGEVGEADHYYLRKFGASPILVRLWLGWQKTTLVLI